MNCTVGSHGDPDELSEDFGVEADAVVSDEGFEPEAEEAGVEKEGVRFGGDGCVC